MRQLVITSGKGGTGKTTVTAGFLALVWRAVSADADVDAPNLHLLLRPKVLEEKGFKGAKTVVKDPELCTECGKCEEHCRFQAIQNLTPDPFRCEGCGVCAYVCPVGALKLEEVETGRSIVSRTKYGPFSHARLYIGAEASGKLVTEVRKNAEKLGQSERLMIIDGPPGIGCPVIASLSGTDLALIVTEPSVSGLHDLERILGVTRHFGVEALVCINKYDLSPEMCDEIARYCTQESIDLVGKIPFDPDLLKVVKQGRFLESLLQTKAGDVIENVWEIVKERLFSGG